MQIIAGLSSLPDICHKNWKARRNAEELKKLQTQAAEGRIDGKGMPHRKRKIIHTNFAVDDKKLQLSLMKLGVNSIPGIEEVMIKNGGTIEDMLSSIISRLDLKGLSQLEKLTNSAVAGDDDDVPELTKNIEKVFMKQAGNITQKVQEISVS
ncbi:hypothetical protein quinque_009639 [Culex quinquefasciatus]